jgi:hypothetical protein
MVVIIGQYKTQRKMGVFASAAKVEFQTRSDKAGIVHINVSIRRFRAAIVAVEKLSITYSECVFLALVIKHGKRTRCSHRWSVWLYHIFPHNIINGTIFEKKLLNILNKFSVKHF